MGRSRGGLTTKLHALVDRRGRPQMLLVTPGQVYDSGPALRLIEGLLPGQTLLADKAYDAASVRTAAEARGARVNIPNKTLRKVRFPFDRTLYRARNAIERFYNKIKQYRGLATRYDKHADTFLAGIILASIRIWIKSNESTA